MLFLGHTRFSLFMPRSDAWHVSNGTFSTDDEYRDYLFRDRRLARRCDIFLNLSLPQIATAAQRWPIRHVVSYSASLPDEYRRQLLEAAARHPFLVLDERGDGAGGVGDERALVERFGGAPGVVGAYRLDDDDLLSADYFEQVAPYLRSENAGMLVSLATGLTALQEADGRFSTFRESYVPMIAIGLMSICRVDEGGSVVAPVWSPHSRADRSNPVILDSRRPSYLWVRHQDQDTTMGYAETAALGRVLDHLATRPIAEGVDVGRLFPAVARRVRPMERVALTSGARALAEPHTIHFDTPVEGLFNLGVEVTCGPGAVANNVLVSLDVVDVHGLPPEAGHMIAGATYSPNPAIGFYRYVSTQEGSRASTHDLVVPSGFTCRGITVRTWRRPETQVTLDRVWILRAAPAAL